MHLPFETHKIYITLNENKMYQLLPDFTKVEVEVNKALTEEVLMNSRKNPFMVIHKAQFDYAKNYLLDIENPFKMDEETAKLYNKIGFVSDEELHNFLCQPSDKY